jgi:NADH:ubiquinone oxidoreductase subunit E
MTMTELRDKLLEEFTVDELNKVDEIIERRKGHAGSLIPILEEVQLVTGFLPDALQAWIADRLHVPPARVFGVVTFYSFFSRVPKGKNQIKVCLGTACYVRGSQKIVDKLKGELGIEEGGVTEDRKFSLETLRCLGACGLAPVMMVGEDTHRQVKPAKLGEILKEYS